MGTVTPNSNIILLKGIPLDNTYNNTVYWNSAAEQLSHFTTDSPWGNTKVAIPQHMYQRVTSNLLRVNIPYSQIYNCNYMLFQNAGSPDYADKWFYAFVTYVEYVNDKATNVYYELDVIQTWFFEFQLERSFVERETVASDGIGEHILAEPFTCDAYDENQYTPLGDDFVNYSVVIATTIDLEGSIEPNDGGE